jgi:hypothetical protein
MDSTAKTGTRLEIPEREFDLYRVHGGIRCLHAQKDACLVLSSEFTFPLGEGRRRAADRLTELRD